MFCDLQQILFWMGSARRGWGNWQGLGFFLSIRCISLAACSSLKGSFKGDRAKLFLVVADGKRRRTRQEFVPEEDQAQQKLPQEVDVVLAQAT